MAAVLSPLRQQLELLADPGIRESGQRFFKQHVKMYGLKSAEVRKIGKSFFSKIKNNSKQSVFELCEQLWLSGYMEEAFIACQWSCNLKNNYVPADLDVFERWLDQYVNNWASCDTLCNHTIGDLVEQFPDKIAVLKTWAMSPNRWMKRGAAVSLIIPARKGMFLTDIFEIAAMLLEDGDDLVQKGYGWMLKAASEYDQQAVFDFVMKHKASMPRTALRYAIEKMPLELKKQAMAK